ncbi:MAG: response regulator [Magnetococcales bacterium]|nr:response regulator [Magnetococcales bacterium]
MKGSLIPHLFHFLGMVLAGILFMRALFQGRALAAFGFLLLAVGRIFQVWASFKWSSHVPDFWWLPLPDLTGLSLLAWDFWSHARSSREMPPPGAATAADTHALQAKLEETVRQRTRELQEARDQAVSANRAKSAFLAEMSHEIRGPLNVVLGLLELLNRAPLASQYREYLQLSHSSGRAVLSLLNDTLDFSKIEAGKLILDRQDFDLRALVDEAALMMAPLAHAKGVELTAFVPRGMNTAVRGDPNRLRQIFINLLGNAVKFTPRGGWVELHGGIVSREETGVEYHFEVWDTGVGVPEDQRERIFAKFEQGTSGYRTGEGTGLGLTISKRLVEMMGGQIGVDANPREQTGSVFHFSILLEEGEQASGPSALRSWPGVRALVVGSGGLQRVLLEDFFRDRQLDHDYEAELPAARERFRAARDSERPYNLMIVNQKAGKHETFQWSRADGSDAARGAPGVILLTDLLDHGWDQAAHLPGRVLCLQKPFNAGRLQQAIDRLVDGEGEALTPIPLLVGEAAPPPAPTWRPGPGGYEQRILLVDDQEANLKVTRGMLLTLGCRTDRVDMVDDGHQAVRACDGTPYDLVLMDCRMPAMGGLEATRAIRAAEDRAGGHRILVVALTADVTDSGRAACMAAGMDGVMTKPLTLRHMETLLERLFGPPGNRPRVAGAGETVPVDVSTAMGSFGLPRETFQEVAELIVAQIPELLAAMARDLDSRRTEEARARAHVLRGSMANAIFPALKEPSQRLHGRIRTQSWEGAQQALADLDRAFEPILNGLRTYLKTHDDRGGDGTDPGDPPRAMNAP